MGKRLTKCDSPSYTAVGAGPLLPVSFANTCTKIHVRMRVWGVGSEIGFVGWVVLGGVGRDGSRVSKRAMA